LPYALGMKTLPASIIAIGFCFAATGTIAANFYPSQLKKVKSFEVEIVVDLDGGCLDNPDALKTEAELVLRRSGIKVVQNEFSGHFLTIHVIGCAIGDGCLAYIGLQTADCRLLVLRR
jgi:hypothetical protein